MPDVIDDITAMSSVEIVDESGAVVLRGRFTEPAEGDRDRTRTAPLSSAADGGAAGSATVVADDSRDGAVTESLTIVADGLKFPSLFHLRLDGRDVTVFSTTLSGRAEVRFERDIRPSTPRAP